MNKIFQLKRKMNGMMGCNMNANSGNYNYFSKKNAKVSFDGFINENYFKTENEEKNLIQNIEITHAITKNPITYKKEAYIGLFFKSKYDGIGARKPLSMSIALDVSGSMSSIDGKDGKSRIRLARDSLKKLVALMNQKDDKMSLITFNHNTEKIFELLDKEEIEKKFLNDIDAIKANGGTDLVGALKAAIDNFGDTNDKNEKRIIMITDVEYCDDNDELFNLFKKCAEEKNISITIIAISQNSNLSLADKISHFKGCNYFSVTKSSELDSFMIKQYNYIFFPIAHETKLKIESENTTLIQCIGGGNEISDEIENNNNGNNTKQPTKEITYDIGSTFSSELLKIKDNEGNEQVYTKGGLMLLKLNYNDLNKNEKLNFNFSLEYTSVDGKKSCQNYSYVIENKNDDNYFKDNNIKKGLSIYYFCIVLNYIVEKEDKGEYEYLNRKKDELKKQKDLALFETRQAVRDYLQKNFVIEPDNNEMNENLKNYLKLIEHSEHKNDIYKFNNLSAAPFASFAY